MVKIVFLLLCVLSFIADSEQKAVRADGDPVKLAVHYESLCGESIRFVEKQLAVTYPVYKDIMEVDIYPYGKAVDVPTEEGGYEFECQHGPEECEGNMMLACAKTYIPDQDTYVEFNICVMSADYPPTAGQACADELGLSFSEIETCRTSIEGEQLLHEVGLVTKSLDPELTHNPWMLLDGVHTREIQIQAQYNLTNFVCDQYTGTTPETCP